MYMKLLFKPIPNWMYFVKLVTVCLLLLFDIYATFLIIDMFGFDGSAIIMLLNVYFVLLSGLYMLERLLRGKK